MKNLIFYLLLLGGTFACSSKAKDTKKETKTENLDFSAEKVVATARIEPETKIVNLSSEVSGIVKSVRVKAGELVKQGDVLLELSNDLEMSQLAQIRQSITITQSGRADIEANIQANQIKAQNALTKLERLKNALAKNAETQQNVDNAETEYKTYLQEIVRLKAQLNTNQTQINQNVQSVRVSEVQLEKRFIKAPTNGTVLSMDLNPGMAIQALSNLMEFAPESPTVAVCEVDELFADQIKIGQKGYVRPIGKTNELAKGEVVFVAPYLRKKSLFSDSGGDLEDRRVREVKIRLNTNQKLLFGMRVEGVILIK